MEISTFYFIISYATTDTIAKHSIDFWEISYILIRMSSKSTTLDRGHPVPLYHQLKEILLHEIHSGKLKPEDRLPSEDHVAATYGVSIITVRRTLTDLAMAGYLRRERGRGTFISRKALEQGPRELTSFSHEMAKRGLCSASRMLAQHVIGADSLVADQLRIPEGAEIFVLRRLRLADGETMGIQTAHIPLALAPDVVREDFSSTSLYDTLHSAILIEGEDAAILRLPEGSSGLAAKRLTFLADGRPFEFVTSVMRGDRYEIVLDLIASR
jgi:GntR family transcriptional regulator